MTVYKGVLHEISEGEKISSEGTGGFYTQNMGIGRWHKTGVDRQAGHIRREVVQIGDTRIRNLMLAPVFDTLLREAIGKEVALSVDGGPPDKFERHTVFAMRTPGAGVVRPPLGLIIFGSIMLCLKFWLAAIVGGIFGTLAAFFVIGQVSTLLGYDEGYAPGIVAAVLGGLFVIYFLLKPFQIIFKSLKLRSARLTLDGDLAEGYSAPRSA